MTKYDNKIKKLINLEQKRQQSYITLIASENYVSKNVLEAQGSVLTNKYVEGYPHFRYYHGCEIMDQLENLAIDLAKKVFGAEHVNVQPHSGSQANEAVYQALLKPGDKILAMALSSGGHLTHGHKKNFSGKLYDFYHYTVDKKSEMINYDDLLKQAMKIKPRLLLAGASSYSRIIDFKQMKIIASKVGALLMVDMAHIAGLVAAKVHPSPVPYADVITTTTHKTLRGARGGVILCKKNLKNKIDAAVFPGIQGGALMGAIAGKAFTFAEALTKSYQKYQLAVVKNCKILAKSFVKGRIISGGTDNHQFSLDVYGSYGISGSKAANILEQAHVIVNQNVIPFDVLPITQCSGIRLGTPACVTRGFQSDDFKILGTLIEQVLIHKGKEKYSQALKSWVRKICEKYPI